MPSFRRRTAIKRAVILVLVSILAAASTSAETIRVKVIDSAGQPFAGASVTWIAHPRPGLAAPPNFSTNAKRGFAEFHNVHPGTHTIPVSAPGHLPVTVGEIVIDERLPPRFSPGLIVVVLNPASGR